MIYRSEEVERNGNMRIAELMSVAVRTAPKACGVDAIEVMVIDGDDKNKLTAAMREIGNEVGEDFFARDAGNVDDCHCIVLVGVDASPRLLDCGLCGVKNCEAAAKGGIPCVLAVSDLGIAIASAAATAMDHRSDNRILYSAGMAALRLKLFNDKVKVCYGIGLSAFGKNIFFDRESSHEED